MSNLNSVLLEGLLKADPMVLTAPGGEQSCEFKIMSKRHYRNKDGLQCKVSCFTVRVHGSLVKIVQERGTKGSACRVVGSLEESSFVLDGQQLSSVIIIAEHVEFRYDKRKDSIKDNISPCKKCPMDMDDTCDTEEGRRECGVYRAYQAVKKQSSTKKKA